MEETEDCSNIRARIKDDIKKRDSHIDDTISALRRKDLDGAQYYLNEAVVLEGGIKSLKALDCRQLKK